MVRWLPGGAHPLRRGLPFACGGVQGPVPRRGGSTNEAKRSDAKAVGWRVGVGLGWAGLGAWVLNHQVSRLQRLCYNSLARGCDRPRE